VGQARFQQGQRVTWKDASGERQRGLVLQHSPPGRDENGSERPEEVLVMREGSAHISALPPQVLDLADLTDSHH
jgi:hypothetical protein